VINAGVPGYSSYQGMRLLEEKFGEWDKDLVICYFGPNDCDAAFLYGDSEQPSDRLLSVRRVLSHSRLYQWFGLWTARGLRARAVSKDQPTASRTEEEWWQTRRFADQIRRRVTPLEMVENYKRITQLAGQQGFRVIFVTCPYVRRPGGPWTDIRVLARYNDAVRQMASRTGATLIDADALFRRPRGDALFATGDPIHPNAKGHAIIAQAILDEMAKQGVLSGRRGGDESSRRRSSAASVGRVCSVISDVGNDSRRGLGSYSNSRRKCIAGRLGSPQAAGQSMQPG